MKGGWIDMIFTLYNSAKEFDVEVTEILKKHEIQNNLLLTNISGGLTREDNSNMVMATVKDDNGKILQTAVRTVPFPMVIYETDNIRNDEATCFFAESLLKQNIDIDCIMTEKELAKSFCKIYSSLTGKSYHNNENLVLYLIEKVNEISLPNGSFRKADESDMYYLPYWYADFIPACDLGDYDLTGGIKSARQAINDGRGYVWMDGVPVSYAANTRRTSNCIFIGNVYTPPTLRGKGYSTACVASLTKKLLDDGWKYCGLYADCANPYSNKVYQNVGYKEVFYYDQYKLYKEI